MATQLSRTDIGRLEVAAAILIRCFSITVGAMVFVWAVLLIAGEPVYQLQSCFFELSRDEMSLLNVSFLTLIKCLNIVLFLFPWAAIRLVLRSVLTEQ